MRSVERAGELLRQGKEVILYDCGGDAALLALSSLDGQFGLKPTAVCDCTPALWGKQLGNFPIYAPAEVAALYPDAWWLITNFLGKAAASRYLVEELRISEGKIINYMAFEQRISCRYLESYFHAREGGLNFCCDAPNRLAPSCVVSNGESVEIVKNLEDLRRNAIRQSGQSTMCEHCRSMSESIYPKASKIELFNYGGGGVCNFCCVYCNAVARGRTSIEDDLDFVQLFDALKRMDILSKDIHVQFNAGEIGVHPKRAEMFAALDGATVSVLTNSSVYCPEIAEALERGQAIVNTSVDAGTRETFRSVKGRDAWDRVHSNLCRYAEKRKGNIVLKYIFLPGINDNAKEVDGFIRLCEECAGYVQISSDFHHPDRDNETTWAAFDYLRAALEEKGILYRISAGAFANRK